MTTVKEVINELESLNEAKNGQAKLTEVQVHLEQAIETFIEASKEIEGNVARAVKSLGKTLDMEISLDADTGCICKAIQKDHLDINNIKIIYTIKHGEHHCQLVFKPHKVELHIADGSKRVLSYGEVGTSKKLSGVLSNYIKKEEEND